MKTNKTVEEIYKRVRSNSRTILYSDLIGIRKDTDERMQVGRDDMWGITTEELETIIEAKEVYGYVPPPHKHTQQLTASQKNSKALVEVCKEKGIELPESLYTWKRLTESEHGKIDRWVLTDTGTVEHSNNFYPAYTTGEFGMMLPTDIKIERKVGALSLKRGWFVKDVNSDYVVKENTEQDARCLMLIYLIKNGYITNLSVKE